ncbi:hypothetical protein ACV07N_03595 [Roseivirga echinicomitans]
MKRYHLVIYKVLPKVTFYTVCTDGKENSETDEFFIRFKDREKFNRDVQIIKYWLEKIGTVNGAQERYFRQEKRAKAIPIPPPGSKLRLYCHRVSDEIVVLGGGGQKTSKKVQDSPDALPHFDLMNDIAAFVNTRLRNQKLTIKDKELIGNLNFTKK